MKINLKKMIITGIITLSILIVYYPTYGQSSPSFPFATGTSTTSWDQNSGSYTDLPNIVDIKDNHSIINGLLSVFGLDSDTINQDEHKFLNYAKAILNIALGLISLIALIMTIYTFYLMFFTENEAGFKKAKGNLVGIFIALAIIGLSWLIVSFIFRWYQNNRVAA